MALLLLAVLTLRQIDHAGRAPQTGPDHKQTRTSGIRPKAVIVACLAPSAIVNPIEGIWLIMTGRRTASEATYVAMR